jgi:hypothetical protein
MTKHWLVTAEFTDNSTADENLRDFNEAIFVDIDEALVNAKLNLERGAVSVFIFPHLMADEDDSIPF